MNREICEKIAHMCQKMNIVEQVCLWNQTIDKPKTEVVRISNKDDIKEQNLNEKRN